MSFDLGKAFQISQAMITARDYALNMVGNSFDDIAIYYPLGDICSYYDSNKTIRITGTPRKNTQVPNSYASWDVLMHEYGHHIQYQMNIINSPKGDHYIDVNHSDDRKNKDEGVRLAWAEAWPTAFAMVAQSYWKSNLSNIRFINDNTYDAYNFDFPYEIENNLDFLGDACEGSIIAVLWDLFDATEQNNSYDTINLGYREFWNVTTGNNVTTFSGFINYFYQLYPNYIQDIGLNLTYHKMASSAPTAVGGTQVDPPTFSWYAQGGSNIFPNNCFYLIFFNKFGDEIHKTASITTTTYTLTQDEWSYILYSLGQEYMVAVSSSQNALASKSPFRKSWREIPVPVAVSVNWTPAMYHVFAATAVEL